MVWNDGDFATPANMNSKVHGPNTVGVTGDNSTRSSRASAVQDAIDTATNNGHDFVYVPDSFLNYDASSVTFDNSVRMVREGQQADVYDVKAYGAAGNGSTDDLSPLQAARDAAENVNGILHFPVGTYRITATFTVSGRIAVTGTSIANNSGSANIAGSVILKDFGGLGVDFRAACTANNLQVRGASGNTGDGVRIANAHVTLRNFISTEHGNDGIRIGEADGSANWWRLFDVLTLDNGNHGLFVHDGGTNPPDANAGYGVAVESRGNGNEGARLEDCRDCVLIQPSATNNTGLGYHIVEEGGHTIIRPYDEGNGTNGGQLDAGVTGCRILHVGSVGSAATDGRWTDNGTNEIVSRESGPPEAIFNEGPRAFENLHVRDPGISGSWEITQDPSTRELLFNIINSGDAGVPVRFANDDGVVELKADRIRTTDGGGAFRMDGSHGDSTKDPTTEAPDDWAEISLGGSTFFIPLYSA